MSGQEHDGSTTSSRSWQPPPPPAGGPAHASRTPASFDGWATVTYTNIASIPLGMIAFIRNLDGRLVVQGRSAKRNEQPPVLLDIPAGEWEWQQEHVQWVERKTPGWAIVLGIIGLFFFLIGLVFFFVKTDVTRTGAGVRLTPPHGMFIARLRREVVARQATAPCLSSTVDEGTAGSSRDAARVADQSTSS